MIVNNRIVETLTFFQWLNLYELTTKKEFRELSLHKQESYKCEYQMWKNGTSQYCK
jgi:hypothetical protein